MLKKEAGCCLLGDKMWLQTGWPIPCLRTPGLLGGMEQPGSPPSSSHGGQGRGAIPPINLPIGWSGYDYGETTSSGSCSSDYSGPRRNKRPRNSKYGHQEDDCEFFACRFSVAQDSLHTMNLWDNFRYPSVKSFKKLIVIFRRPWKREVFWNLMEP